MMQAPRARVKLPASSSNIETSACTTMKPLALMPSLLQDSTSIDTLPWVSWRNETISAQILIASGDR
jgi:hypothetical protein